MRKSGEIYHADTAVVLGDVTLGDGCNLWPGASIRGDVAPITFGTRCNVQDNATVHCDAGRDLVIGNDVTIAHNAIVHGRAVGDCTLIGMHATVMGGVTLGHHCLIAAGALVPPNTHVPDHTVAIGSPAKKFRDITEDELKYLAHLPPHYLALAQRHVAGAYRSIFTG